MAPSKSNPGRNNTCNRLPGPRRGATERVSEAVSGCADTTPNRRR